MDIAVWKRIVGYRRSVRPPRLARLPRLVRRPRARQVQAEYIPRLTMVAVSDDEGCLSAKPRTNCFKNSCWR